MPWWKPSPSIAIASKMPERFLIDVLCPGWREPVQEKSLLSVVEVALALGVTRGQVQKLIVAGRLPAQKVGRSYVVQAADLNEFERRPVGRPRKGEGEE